MDETLNDLGIPVQDVNEVFIVEEATALEDTLALVGTAPPGSTVAIVLAPGVFPISPPPDLDVDLIIVGGDARRRLLEVRELQAGTVIYAVDNGRHFSTTRLLALSKVTLQGSFNSGAFSGGVQLTVRTYVR